MSPLLATLLCSWCAACIVIITRGHGNNTTATATTYFMIAWTTFNVPAVHDDYCAQILRLSYTFPSRNDSPCIRPICLYNDFGILRLIIHDLLALIPSCIHLFWAIYHKLGTYTHKELFQLHSYMFPLYKGLIITTLFLFFPIFDKTNPNKNKGWILHYFTICFTIPNMCLSLSITCWIYRYEYIYGIYRPIYLWYNITLGILQ